MVSRDGSEAERVTPASDTNEPGCGRISWDRLGWADQATDGMGRLGRILQASHHCHGSGMRGGFSGRQPLQVVNEGPMPFWPMFAADLHVAQAFVEGHGFGLIGSGVEPGFLEPSACGTGL